MKYAANGIRLNVVEQGSGPLTLVFLHYFGGSSREWQLIIDQLSNQYRCIAIDLRGHGDSDAPATGYSVDDMADDVAALVQVLNVQNFILVGHSMSGKVALALAARTVFPGIQTADQPDRHRPHGLRSLVLVAPSPPLPEPIAENDRRDMLARHGQRSAAEQTFGNITEKPVSERLKELIIADNLRTSDTAWKAWLTEGSREDISSRMNTVDVPVAIIFGDADRALRPDVQEKMVMPYLKTATLDSLEDVGHLIPLESPAMFVDFIQKKIAAQWPN